MVLKDSLLGLAAAHSRRVAHRDVKPDNVLIDATGWCTLTDFGIAVQTDKQMPAPGTPEYMAPELWNGAPNLPASDMYAATVVLCESLTGKPPFSGRAGRLRQQHESEPVPLDQYEPPLRDLIGWGLAKYSDRRPPSAWAFVGEIDARAAAAYGPLWEEEGRRELAERAEAVMALAADDGGAGGGSAQGEPPCPAQDADLRLGGGRRADRAPRGGSGPAVQEARQGPAEQRGRRGRLRRDLGDAAGGGLQVQHAEHVHLHRRGHRPAAGTDLLPVAVLHRGSSARCRR